MAANYPGNTVSFTQKVDSISNVNAADVNLAYEEIQAIATELGLNPSDRTSGASNTFDGTTSAFDTVKLRLDNIETGARVANTLLVSNVGGSTILASASGVKGLIIKAAASQSANLLEFQNNGSTTPVSYVTAAGNIYTPTIDGGGA
jgi:hypothetical protein